MNKTLFLLLVWLSVSGCKTDSQKSHPEGTNSLSRTADVSSVIAGAAKSFDLFWEPELGDLWVYRIRGGPRNPSSSLIERQRVISKKVVPVGIEYTRLDSTYNERYQRTQIETTHFRVTNHNELISDDQTINFNANVGDKWNFEFYEATLISKTDSLTLDSMTYYSCYKFTIKDVVLVSMHPSESTEWYVKDIGLVYSKSINGGHMALVETRLTNNTSAK